MFQQIRRIFFRFRVLLGALRTGIFGVALVCATWVFAAPPSDLERDRLSLSNTDTAQNEALRTHRMAKLLTLVGTDRIYQIVADRANNGMTAQDVRLGVFATAQGIPTEPDSALPTGTLTTRFLSGYTVSNGETTADLDIDQIQKNSVRAGGAKFVSARSN